MNTSIVSNYTQKGIEPSTVHTNSFKPKASNRISTSTLTSQAAETEGSNCCVSCFSAIFRGIKCFFMTLFCCFCCKKEKEEEKKTIFDQKGSSLNYLMQMDQLPAKATIHLYESFVDEMPTDLQKKFKVQRETIARTAPPTNAGSVETEADLLGATRQVLVLKFQLAELQPVMQAIQVGDKNGIQLAVLKLSPRYREHVLHNYYHKVMRENDLSDCDDTPKEHVKAAFDDILKNPKKFGKFVSTLNEECKKLLGLS